MGTVSEDVSLLSLADEDRSFLICEQRSVGADGDSAGRGEEEEDWDLSHFHYPDTSTLELTMSNISVCPFNHSQSPTLLWFISPSHFCPTKLQFSE